MRKPTDRNGSLPPGNERLIHLFDEMPSGEELTLPSDARRVCNSSQENGLTSGRFPQAVHPVRLAKQVISPGGRQRGGWRMPYRGSCLGAKGSRRTSAPNSLLSLFT